MKNLIIRTALASTMLAASFGIANADISDKVASGAYTMDKTHGYVTFTYSHFGLSNPVLTFNDVDANVTLDAANPTDSSVDVTIAASSIDSGVEVFDGHLNSDQWFNTAEFPTITFKSTSLTQADDGTGTLTGDLTVKGITKPVTLDVTMLGAGPHPLSKVDTVGIQATTTVLRSEFDLGAYAPAVSDEIVITISGEFNKVEAPKGS